MELTDARRTLGISATDEWDTIRTSYRRLIGAAHPDRVGDENDRAIILNEAYRVLSRARREGRLHDEPARTPAATPNRGEERRRKMRRTPVTDVRILDNTTLVFDCPPAETFRRLVEAGDALGHISYVDRSAAILEVMVTLEDDLPASLVFSLQWRAHDATCEAFATLEAIDRAEQLDVSLVLRQVLALLPDAIE